MPRVDIAAARERVGHSYAEPYRSRTGAKHRRVLGDAAGLTQFGVNLSTLPPGAQSALRHWHENEDEFVWVLSGEVVLIEDGGETVFRVGDCAGFSAGVANGHHLVNRSDWPATFLEVGARARRARPLSGRRPGFPARWRSGRLHPQGGHAGMTIGRTPWKENA